MEDKIIQADLEIKKLMSSMVDAFNYEELAQNIVSVFAELFNAELCSIWRLVERNGQDQLELSASIGIHRKPGDIVATYPLSSEAKNNEFIQGVTAWIAITKSVCLANSYQELKYDKSKPWYGTHRGQWDDFQFPKNEDKNFKNLLGLPIIYNEGGVKDKLVGVLKVESTRHRNAFSLSDKELAMRLIPFVAIALQTMSVREQREQNRQHVLKDLTGVLLHESTTFYQEVVDKTAELLRADICSLWLADDENKKLTLGANYGVSKKGEIPEYELLWDAKDNKIGGLTPWVFIRKTPFFGEKHEDLRDHPAWKGVWDPDQWEGKVEISFGCLYAVPLLNVDDKPFGVLKIENQSKKPKFDAVDRATFDLIADFIALAIEFNSRLRADIVYDFFHLLKQPIATTVMAFQDLRKESSLKNPRKERIDSRYEMLARNLQTVSVWITNVYGMATIKQDEPEEKATSVPVGDLLASSIDTMRNMFPKFKCDLSKVEQIVLQVTPLQRKKIDAIFYNLLDNSFRYSIEPRKIAAEATRTKNSINLVVSDNGKGIAPEDIDLVCKPYVTKGSAETSTARMGLGLSTVVKLIKGFGWTHNIDSYPDKGTRFIITIPEEIKS